MSFLHPRAPHVRYILYPELAPRSFTQCSPSTHTTSSKKESSILAFRSPSTITLHWFPNFLRRSFRPLEKIVFSSLLSRYPVHIYSFTSIYLNQASPSPISTLTTLTFILCQHHLIARSITTPLRTGLYLTPYTTSSLLPLWNHTNHCLSTRLTQRYHVKTSSST